MNKLKEIPYSEMRQLERAGGFGFHGSPILPELLENYQGVPEGSLVPLHAPRNLDRKTGLHRPRTADRIARVSFFDLLAPATARGVFHAGNHTSLAPVDCVSGYDLGVNNGLHLKATAVLLEDTVVRGQDLQAAVYATSLDGLQPSPDESHDHWSAGPVQPEYVSRVDGTILEHLAHLCASGEIEVIPPFRPDFNNC